MGFNKNPKGANEYSLAKEHGVDVDITIDDDTGIETIIFSSGDIEIKNRLIIQKAKMTKIFSDNLELARRNFFKERTEHMLKFIELHKLSPKIPEWENLKDQLTRTTPKLYIRAKFKEEKPNRDVIIEELQDEANKIVRGILFVKTRRRMYVEKRFEDLMIERSVSWQKRRNAFEDEEDRLEVIENDKILKHFVSWKKELHDKLNPTEQIVNKQLFDTFSDVDFPSITSVVSVNNPEFSFKKPSMLENIEVLPLKCGISFETNEEEKTVMLDIDLPSIDDYPKKSFSIVSKGKISVKKKSAKGIKLSYFKCISAMSIYFASICFSIYPFLETVVVTGFKNVTSKALNDEENQSIYSVKYDIQNFRDLDIENIEPAETIQSFDHRMKLTKSYDLKKIIPFE